jgi:hypothetical protein
MQCRKGIHIETIVPARKQLIARHPKFLLFLLQMLLDIFKRMKRMMLGCGKHNFVESPRGSGQAAVKSWLGMMRQP